MDELTQDQKNLIAELENNEAYKLLKKLVEDLKDEMEKQILAQAENYSAVKSH